MNVDRWLSIITWAGIAGLVILNAKNATDVIKAIGGTTVDYVKAVQGQ